MEKVYLFVILVLAYYFMRMITGVHILEVIGSILKVFTRNLVAKTEEFTSDTQIKFSRMSLDEKHKSKKYKFYCFVTEILDAFGLKSHGVTVEGFVVTIAVASLVLAMGISVLMGAFFLFLLFAPMIFVVSMAGVFLASRMNVRKRKQLLLDTMDILCSVMTDGILLAVKNNIGQIPEEVRGYFERFIKNVELLNLSIPHSVNILNQDVGSLYDEFCDSVITYELNRASGMEELFNFYIMENAKTTARDREIKRISDSVNLDFFATVAAIILFGILSSNILGSGDTWTTPLGLVVIIGLSLMGVGVFIYIQYLLSKPYIYTERK